MKVTDHLAKANGTLFSFEVLPSLKGRDIQDLYNGIEPLMEFNPSFINVTYHREEFIYKKLNNGLHEKIKGLGVVGYQPLLQPGEKFQYTSGTRLRTPTGTMHGSYFCVAEDGEKFDVDIPMFILDALSNESGKRNLH